MLGTPPRKPPKPPLKPSRSSDDASTPRSPESFAPPFEEIRVDFDAEESPTADKNAERAARWAAAQRTVAAMDNMSLARTMMAAELFCLLSDANDGEAEEMLRHARAVFAR